MRSTTPPKKRAFLPRAVLSTAKSKSRILDYFTLPLEPRHGLRCLPCIALNTAMFSCSLASCRLRIQTPDRKIERRGECDPSKIRQEQQRASNMNREEQHDRRDNGQPDQNNVDEAEVETVQSEE